MRNGLSDYVHRLQQQGHSRTVIRAHLSRFGYSPLVVSEVVGPSFPATHPAQTRYFLIGISVVFLLMFVGSFFWWFFQSLDVFLQLSPSVTSVLPGGAFVFEKVVSSSREKTQVDVVHELLSGGKPIAERREKLLISGSQKILSKFFVPANVKSGDYVLRVTAFFDGHSVSEQFSVTVQELSVSGLSSVKNVSELPKTCPASCVSVSPCMQSECVDGECVSAQIIPCCGNGRCEAEETVSSCSTDCGAPPSSKESVVDSALSVVKKDVSRAVLLCNSLIEDVVVDSCIETISKDAQTSAVCDSVRSVGRRDGCYMSFVLDGDFSVCDKIADRYQSNSCWYLAQAKEFQSHQPI